MSPASSSRKTVPSSPATSFGCFANKGTTFRAVPDQGVLFEALTDEPPDVLIVDAGRLNGSDELLERLRDDQRWNDVRVIVSTPATGITAVPARPRRAPTTLCRSRSAFPSCLDACARRFAR